MRTGQTYYCNVYVDGLVTVWLSRETAAFDRKCAAIAGRKVPVMVVAKMKSRRLKQFH